MRFNRDRVIGFVWGFLVGVLAMWLSTFLPIPFWVNAIVLVFIGLVVWPALRSRLINRNPDEP